MLFVSPHPGYMLLGIRQPKDNYHSTTGQYMSTDPGIDAEFIHGAPYWAKEMFIHDPKFVQKWGGIPDEVDRYTMFGSYDTVRAQGDNDWDEATRKMVEEKMLKHPDFGNSYFLAVPPVEIADLPWPNYDNTHHFRVVITAKEIGADLREVLEYEKNHRNRKAVIDALEAELKADVDTAVPA